MNNFYTFNQYWWITTIYIRTYNTIERTKIDIVLMIVSKHAESETIMNRGNELWRPWFYTEYPHEPLLPGSLRWIVCPAVADYFLVTFSDFGFSRLRDIHVTSIINPDCQLVPRLFPDSFPNRSPLSQSNRCRSSHFARKYETAIHKLCKLCFHVSTYQ